MRLENSRVLANLGIPVTPHWSGSRIEAYGQTDVGRIRDSNQDSYVVEPFSGIFMVADGMGGRAGGEIASNLAVSVVRSEVQAHLEDFLSRDISARRALMAQIINRASLRIYEHALELPQEYREMGTTTVALWIPPTNFKTRKHANTAIISNVGDSRCYLMRSSVLYQITEDHSQVVEQVKAGNRQRSDPTLQQIRNVITRCVGYQECEEVDTFALQLFQEDRFLLCSDGLTNKVSDLEIAEALQERTLSEIPSELIAQANKRGGDDNITCVVVSVS